MGYHFVAWQSVIIVASISDLLAPKWHKTVQNKLQYGPDCVWKVSKMGLIKNKSMKTHLSERCKDTFCSSCMSGRHPQRSQEMSLKHTLPHLNRVPTTVPSASSLLPHFLPPLAWCVCGVCSDTIWQQDASCSYYRHPRGRQTHLNPTSHSIYPYNTHTLKRDKTANSQEILSHAC